MIKRISMIICAVIFSFCFISVAQAEELDLNDVASLSNVIGGEDKEINEVGNGSYKYYYKIQAIDDNDFATYVSSKYVFDNGDENTDEYVEAQTRVAEYEDTFYGLIPVINSTSDLNGWTESTDKNINPTNLNYETEKHHGYVLAVVAVKDQTIYATRVILESTSATTLGSITYNLSDETAVANTTTQSVTEQKSTRTTSNPETGIDDYAMYLVPVAIIMGSVILLKRNYA